MYNMIHANQQDIHWKQYSLFSVYQVEQFEQFIESRKHRTQIMGMRDIVQLYTMVQQIMYA